MIRLSSAVLSALLVTTAAGAQQPERQTEMLPPVRVSLEAKDFGFAPNEVVVPKERMVLLTVTNGGTMVHNVEVLLNGAKVKFENPLAPGEVQTLSFRAPQQAGRYEIYCPLEDHRARGMKAALVVR